MTPVNIDYFPAKYCLDRGFQFLIPGRNNWEPNTVVHPEHLDIYTEDFKLDSAVGSAVYAVKLYLSISLQLPKYCSVFQAKVMAVYRAAQWTLVTCVSVFSDSHAAIRSLSDFVNNCRIAWECHRCLDLLSGLFNASLVWVSEHSNVLGNYKADELTRAGTLLPESSLIVLGMPLASFKLGIAWKFFRDANLF